MTKKTISTSLLKDFALIIENLTKQGYKVTYDGMMICNLVRNGENIEVILKSGENA